MTKKVEKVTKVPKMPGYTGLTISRKSIEFTPNKILDALGAPKKGRPVWLLKPFSVDHRHAVDADEAKVMSLVSIWARDNKISLMSFQNVDENTSTEEYVSYKMMMDHYSDKKMKAEIVRECISGVKFDSEEMFKFEKDEDGFLKEEIFNDYHPKLISEFYDKLYEMSNPNRSLTMGL